MATLFSGSSAVEIYGSSDVANMVSLVDTDPLVEVRSHFPLSPSSAAVERSVPPKVTKQRTPKC
ncbi:hypothetical protein OUZ56_005217 [Daphnia magna]|uniref:Uncharacterized protein n=1 Tax=Daphnia magna TaxID=35525 RepID=A0ABQ9YS58_9CRUS|nr:hypothetical protein OUZ56_005217 [Daphnia magna]